MPHKLAIYPVFFTLFVVCAFTLPACAQTGDSPVTVFDYGNPDPYDLTNLHGFNHAPSVVHVGGGRVIAAWFSGPYEASVHQSIVGATSDDGGRTWSKSTVLNDAPRTSDFDPAFIRDGGRTHLFYSTGRWTRWPFVGIGEAAKKQVGTESFQIHVRTSDDGGATWGESRDVEVGRGWNCRSNGIRLSNGDLLLPTHYLAGPYRATAAWSSDGGQTWTLAADVAIPDGIGGAAEPSVAELPDGQVIMSLRTRDGNLWFARSDDRGRSWKEPEKSGLPAAGSSSNVMVTRDGTLVLTHNPTTADRTQLTLRTSTDGGRTWAEPLLIAQVQPPAAGDAVWARQVAYPSVCELDDGTLLVVWTEIEMSPEAQSGIVRAMRVRL